MHTRVILLRDLEAVREINLPSFFLIMRAKKTRTLLACFAFLQTSTRFESSKSFGGGGGLFNKAGPSNNYLELEDLCRGCCS